MTSFDEKSVAWRDWLQRTSVTMVGGGATTPTCPLCSGEHEVCRFAAGHSFCVNPGCANPHHRQNPNLKDTP